MFLTFLFFIFIFLIPPASLAVCPVCIVAVGTGVGLSRYLGIDDTVTGVWIGGLIVTISVWTATWAKKKWPKIKFALPVSFVIYTLMSVVPFWQTDIIGHSLNRLWGIDKLILGMATGMALFVAGVRLDKWLRTKHEGRVFFPYQKVIVPVVSLLLGSLVFFLATR